MPKINPCNPYNDQPDRAFWRRAVASSHVTQMRDLFEGVPGLADAKIATAGSCFAQHIGRELKGRGLHYLDYEPAPPFLNAEDADRLGYGIYSCRYGNIYTVRQLKQLFDEAFGRRTPADLIWAKDGRLFDALRPGIEPNGFGCPEEVLALRASHLSRVRALFSDLDLFVFTLGLTEAWTSKADGTVYPMAPGVIAGQYNSNKYNFVNFRYNEILADILSFIEALRSINSEAKLLLTVSPVPLMATATKAHVLVATTYSKSVLRSVAGDLSADVEGVYYFPSYEVIVGQPARHMYYNPDLRTVCQAGVKEVMRHFFNGIAVEAAETKNLVQADHVAVSLAGFEHCEESLLDEGAK